MFDRTSARPASQRALGLARNLVRFALVFAFATPSLAGGSHRGLRLEAASPAPRYANPERFRVHARFANPGDVPVVVLPAQLRRRYREIGGATAQYLPFPGPPVSPWRGAFVLEAGDSQTVALSGMRDADGVWRLAAGRYALVLSYSVGPEIAAQRATEMLPPQASEARIWEGTLTTAPIQLMYEPPEASRR